VTGLEAAKGVMSVGAVSTLRGQPPGPTPHRLVQTLAFTPRALILWWSCQEGDGCAPGNRGGVGFAVAGSAAGAVAWVSESDAPTARTASWVGPLPVVGLRDAEADTPALRAEVAFSPNAFELQVLEAKGVWRVHYLALGGGQVRAGLGWLTAPNAPGEQRIELGLRPDLLLFASAAVGPSPSPALGRTDPQASPTRGLSIAFGAATGADAQGGAALLSPDGAPPGAVAGAQRTDAALLAVADRTNLESLASVTSVDPDGVSLMWSRTSSIPRRVLYLALSGAGCRLTPEFSPAAPGRRRRRGLGVSPRALLCYSWGLGASSGPSDIGRLSLGGASASSGVASAPPECGAVSWDDRDTAGDETATHVHSSTDQLLLVADTQTGGLHAAARAAGFGRDGFTLDWSPSDGSRRQFLCVALGTPSQSPLRTAAAGLLSRLGR
jgi:hypothetical protein